MAKSLDDTRPRKKSVRPDARRPPATFEEKLVFATLDRVMEFSIDEPARHEWRVSSFPICGMLHLIKQIQDKPKPKPYSMGYFTEVGTAVHENIQYHFVNSPETRPYVIGNFECRACAEPAQAGDRKPRYWCTAEPAGTHVPDACARCGNRWLHYIELDFAAHGIGGHLDLLTEYPDGRRVAWEFKTTSGDNVEDPSKYLPYPKHHFQIETYSYLLHHHYRRLPTDIAIVYLNRDPSFSDAPPSHRLRHYPFVYPVTRPMMELRRAELQRTIKARRAVLALMEQPTLAALDELGTHRPCGSADGYKTGMKPTFFGNEQCPYAKEGTCWAKNLPGRIRPLNDIWSMLQNPGPAGPQISIPAGYDEPEAP